MAEQWSAIIDREAEWRWNIIHHLNEMTIKVSKAPDRVAAQLAVLTGLVLCERFVCLECLPRADDHLTPEGECKSLQTTGQERYS